MIKGQVYVLLRELYVLSVLSSQSAAEGQFVLGVCFFSLFSNTRETNRDQSGGRPLIQMNSFYTSWKKKPHTTCSTFIFSNTPGVTGD